jgi:hypothetical protein
MARTPAVKQKSTALATTSFSEELDDLKSRLAAPSGDKIKIDTKGFTLPSGARAEELDVVILDFVYFNAYYENGFVKGVVESPVCFSLSADPKGAAPSAKSPDPQCDGCDGCPQNQFGTKGKGKACKNRVRIAVLPADMASTNENTRIVILDIPPTSVKGFQNYVASVARSIQRPPYGVVTHVTYDDGVDYPMPLFGQEPPQPFDMEDPDAVAFVEMLRARRQEARERLLVEPDPVAANDTPVKKTALKAPAKRRA